MTTPCQKPNNPSLNSLTHEGWSEWEKLLVSKQQSNVTVQVIKDRNGTQIVISQPPPLDDSEKHKRLVLEALQLKRAWLLAAAILGRQFTEKELFIENYISRDNKWLKRHIANLQDDFELLAKQMLLDWNRGNLASATAWLAQQYEAWMKAGFGVFELGRVYEVEKVLGRLGYRRFNDCPPYAQVLLQGYYGAAIRHPEYHLATDLALLFNLFLDAEALNDEAMRQKKVHSSEHSQSLARSVILTCFNLLESFTSGLGAAYLIETPNVPEKLAQQLKGLKPNGRDLGLREKIVLFPSLITGKPKLDENQPPLKELFGECKQRRDSFVHCEPGPQDTKWGYNKETRFHQVDRDIVQKTVNLTCETICLSWKTVHGKDRPTWLPKRDGDGRFESVQVRLLAIEEI